MTLAVLTAALVFSTTLSPLDDGPASCKTESTQAFQCCFCQLTLPLNNQSTAMSTISAELHCREAKPRTRKNSEAQNVLN